MINLLRHSARPYVFSGALPPAQAAAAIAAFDLLEEEPERVVRLEVNQKRFLAGLKSAGFNTLQTTTPIFPILCGDEERALRMAQVCNEHGVFVLPIIYPAVAVGKARLRCTVTAAHTADDIDRALDVFEKAGRAAGVI